MKKINLFVLLFLMGYHALAQSDYLVTNKSDTIKGELRILSYDRIDRVQVVIDNKKEMYTAIQILTLKKDDAFFKPVQFEQSIRLMKIIKSGYLGLYGFKLPNMSTFDGRFLVKLDGSSMELPNLGFKKILSSYLEDCNEISVKIKNGDLTKVNIEEIVETYNVCLSQQKPVVPTAQESAQVSSVRTNQLESIGNLKNKITEQTFSGKDDALDILRDIESKVDRNENISNYLLDGLKSVLKEQPTLVEDIDKLITLFKK